MQALGNERKAGEKEMKKVRTEQNMKKNLKIVFTLI